RAAARGPLPERGQSSRGLGRPLEAGRDQGRDANRRSRSQLMSASPPRQMSIGMNILGLGGHGAAWRVGESPSRSLIDAEYFCNIARISERGKLDGIFLADGPALQGDIAHQPAGRLEPTLLLAAVAVPTTHIGT